MARPSDPNARIKLLAAAESVFSAHGLDDAKVEEIAARAGLAKGSFYLHFASKDEAFRQLIEMMLARLKAQVDALAEDTIPPGMSLAALLDRWVSQDTEIFEFVWQNRALVGLMLDGGRCAAYRHLVDGFCDEAAQKSKRILLRGIDAGIYRKDFDIDVASAFIGGAYDRLARNIVREPQRPDLPRLLREVQLLVLRGVASHEALAALDELAAARPSRRSGASRTARIPAPRTTAIRAAARKNRSTEAAFEAAHLSRKARKRAPR
jgi:AcrR family transcriptional regulator